MQQHEIFFSYIAHWRASIKHKRDKGKRRRRKRKKEEDEMFLVFLFIFFPVGDCISCTTRKVSRRRQVLTNKTFRFFLSFSSFVWLAFVVDDEKGRGKSVIVDSKPIRSVEPFFFPFLQFLLLLLFKERKTFSASSGARRDGLGAAQKKGFTVGSEWIHLHRRDVTGKELAQLSSFVYSRATW